MFVGVEPTGEVSGFAGEVVMPRAAGDVSGFTGEVVMPRAAGYSPLIDVPCPRPSRGEVYVPVIQSRPRLTYPVQQGMYRC